ncbi:DNA primase large subunit [Leptinotarsa decemlineata]|uniref:DNA primase large subunit n=2 Tax=Leptinotarsa decemlineata TaxID=7539 RepID=UPI003D305AD7
MEDGPYKFNLNMYKSPPKGLSSIPLLEKLCNERISLYKLMEEAKILNLTPNTRKWNTFMESQIKVGKLHTYDILLNQTNCVGISQARLDDHIAHWFLSLCYCRTHKLRHCFIIWELQWFILIYRRMDQSDLQKFLVENDFVYLPVSSEEKESLKDKLLRDRNFTEAKFESISYFKTYFTEIAQLVALKKIFLLKGIAYFPETDIIYCIVDRLRTQISIHLQWINKMFSVIAKDDHIKFLLQNISPFIPKEYQLYSIDDINLENIDEVANNHYPLCMKTIHLALRNDHHLKYDSKMQYGIFLKCTGLSYENAMQFWKNEFTQSMSLDLYQRKYSYLFKHQYGMVGGRIQYRPFTCENIQKYSPSPGQYHGCPFKHWDKENLIQKLQCDGLQTNDINYIKELIDKGRYQNACTRYFCVNYQVFRDDVIQSPNQYTYEGLCIDRHMDNVLSLICGNLDKDFS